MLNRTKYNYPINKLLLITLLYIIINLFAHLSLQAQPENANSQQYYNLITTIRKTQIADSLQVNNNPDLFTIIDNDTLYFDVNNNYDYYKIYKYQNYLLAEHGYGKIGDLKYMNLSLYLFTNNKLLQTVTYYYERSYALVEDAGYNLYVMEEIIDFEKDIPIKYTVKETEDLSTEINLSAITPTEILLDRLLFPRERLIDIGYKIIKTLQ